MIQFALLQPCVLWACANTMCCSSSGAIGCLVMTCWLSVMLFTQQITFQSPKCTRAFKMLSIKEYLLAWVLWKRETITVLVFTNTIMSVAVSSSVCMHNNTFLVIYKHSFFFFFYILWAYFITSMCLCVHAWCNLCILLACCVCSCERTNVWTLELLRAFLPHLNQSIPQLEADVGLKGRTVCMFLCFICTLSLSLFLTHPAIRGRLNGKITHYLFHSKALVMCCLLWMSSKCIDVLMLPTKHTFI